MTTINKAFKVKNGLTVEGGQLQLPAGTTSYPPILLTSGTNLTSATAGAFEFDGTNFYLTPSSTRKTVAFLDSSITGSAGSVANSILFAATGGASPSTSFNGSAARTVDYSTVGAAASSHVHGNISNAGAIGSTAGLIVKTTTGGALTTLAAGTSGQFLQYDGTWATPTGATYSQSAVTTTGGAFLRLTGSDASTDDVKFASGTNTTVAYTDANTITISSTDTNYYPTAFAWTAGTTAGPTGSLTGSGMSAVSYSAIPAAATGASGIVTTGAQAFDGVKTFNASPIVPTPTNATDAANKAYVDNAVVGIDWKASVKMATTDALLTTGNLTGSATSVTYANGTSGVGATLTVAAANWSTITIDGQTLVVGDRILIKNQATALQNGIYTVTSVGSVGNGISFVFTRATDDDTAADNTSGHAVFVEAGSTNADSGWVNTTDGAVTVGTTSISYTQFTGLGQITAGAGLTKTGNTLDAVGTTNRIVVNADSIDIDANYVGQTSITTLGTIGTGTWNATAIGTTKGGTGLTSFTSGGAVYATSTSALTTGTLPVASGGTGLTALGTGVATALGTNVNSASGFVTYSGNVGAATATSINKVAITAPATSATLTLANGSTLATVGAFATTLTATAATSLTLPTSGTLIANPLATSGTTSALNITGQATSAIGGSAGDVIITGGTGTNASGNGGYVRIYGGQGGASNTAGGSVLIEGSPDGAAGNQTVNGSVFIGTNKNSTAYVGVGDFNQFVSIAGNEYRTSYVTAATVSSPFTASMWTGGFSTVSAKLTITASTATDVHVVEALVVKNAAGNFYITTYGEVTSNASLFTFTVSGTADVVVTPVGATSTNITVASIAYATIA